MSYLTRRTLVKGGTAVAAASVLTGPALLEWAKAWAQNAPWKPEKGAKLSMLRWKYFVQAEDDAFVKLIEAFSKATGVPVEISRESYEDVQPKASVAANTGTGPDLFWGLYSLPHLFPQKCMDVTDVADYLGKKYGGWVESAVQYGKSGNKWICVPICYSGNMVNYRIEASKKAGFSKIPDKTDGFLEYAKAMKKNNTPGGFALGHASGDGNGWVHWCLWSQGGNTVDKSDKVIINSPETAKALELRQGALRRDDSGRRFVERCIQQQGVPGWRNQLDRQRHLHLCRGTKGSDQEEYCRGHGPFVLADRPGRKAHRIAPDVSGAGHDLLEVSAGL